MTFTLFFSDDDTRADSEGFGGIPSLDRARDIAFDISLESGREVTIFCGSHSWETVMA